MAPPVAALPLPGTCSRPVTCGRALALGLGTVVPEVKYTLAPVRIGPETIGEVRAAFRRMAGDALARAEALAVPGIVLELEHPFELTLRPDWGALAVEDAAGLLDRFHARTGIPCALRVTVADIRDRVRPPRMRTGAEMALILEAARACARAGADILSIESTGGKEVSDEALPEGDLAGVLFGMLSLGGRDLAVLWDGLADATRGTRAILGGDSACGFGNTAMRLADMGYLPRVLAAVVRAAGAARTVVSFEHGAIGPGKDCAYENAYLKAVLGVPVSMEGKTAASAHFSHVGNVALAWADLWSNESVQDVRLLSGGAPAVFAEMLAYDCRLVNEAIRRGEAARLQEWLAASDAPLDPQAWVLAPACVGRVAEALRGAAGPYARGVAAARAAAEQLAGARASGLLTLAPREAEWLDRLRRTLDALPEDEAAFIAARLPERRDRFLPSEYGIG